MKKQILNSRVNEVILKNIITEKITSILLLISLILVPKISESQCNVALNKPATASGTYFTTSTSMAFDGNKNTLWSVPAYTGCIQIDLQAQYSIDKINLLIAQTPNGNTIHKIYSAPSIQGPWTLVETISGNTSEGQLLARSYSNPLQNVGAFKFETTQSPSWVSWYEIEIISNSTTKPTATITPQSTTAFCQNASVVLNASNGAGYSYEW